MGAPERLAILNAKTVHWDTGEGGVHENTWENLAGALGLCSRDGAMTARAILLLDPQSVRSLIGRLMGVTMRFNLASEQRVALVTRLVREEIQPNRCGNCEGRGEAMLGAQKVVCPVCGGTGLRRRRFAPSEEAAAHAVSTTISMWLSDALSHIAREEDDAA